MKIEGSDSFSVSFLISVIGHWSGIELSNCKMNKILDALQWGNGRIFTFFLNVLMFYHQIVELSAINTFLLSSTKYRATNSFLYLILSLQQTRTYGSISVASITQNRKSDSGSANSIILTFDSFPVPVNFLFWFWGSGSRNVFAERKNAITNDVIILDAIRLMRKPTTNSPRKFLTEHVHSIPSYSTPISYVSYWKIWLTLGHSS